MRNQQWGPMLFLLFLALAGQAALTYGLWLIWPPLGWIWAGFSLLTMAAHGSGGLDKKKNAHTSQPGPAN